MIIVSQNKNIIVNFNNISNINVEKCYNESIKEEDFTFDIYAYAVASGMIRIGKYETEERAKEVLKEIVEAIKGKSQITMTQEELITEAYGGYYEMPED